MKTLCLTVAAFIMAAFKLSAATHYVSLESTNPTPPYTNWVTAATNIQDAVDVANTGDTVLVTNGVYAVGGRQPPQLVSVGVSRVVVTNSIRLESVNGPLVTTIWGSQLTNEVGEITNGFRCVFLGSNAVLSGFTLTKGFGGVLCEFAARGWWSPPPPATAVVSNCTLTGNSGYDAGGVDGGTLYNCTLSSNSTLSGGGARWSTLYNCTLTSNSAWYDGGGAWECTLYNCTLTGNSAGDYGGGVFNGDLHDCILTRNSALWGGGAYGFVSAPFSSGCFLTDCTLAGNSAYEGGGVWGHTIMGNSEVACELNNCIVYFNTSESWQNYGPAMLNYCCTTPLPIYGIANITNAPLFVNTNNWSDLRLHSNSPCIDAGTNLTGLISTDILGLPRPMDGNNDGIARCDIGAYEFNPYRFEPTLHLSANGFHFIICGEPNRSVHIERSRDLVNWEFAAQVPIPIGGQTLIDPAATSESKLFYRAMRVP